MESYSKTLLSSPVVSPPSSDPYFALLQFPPGQLESRSSSSGCGRPEISVSFVAFETLLQRLPYLDSLSMARVVLIAAIALRFRCSRSGMA